MKTQILKQVLFMILFIAALMVTSCIVDKSAEPKPELVDLSQISWQPTSMDSGSISFFASKTDGRIFTNVGVQGLYYSDDLGENWNPIASGYHMRYMAFAPNDDIYVVTTCSYASATTIRSRDGGLNWTEIPNPAYCTTGMLFHPSGTIFIGDYGSEAAEEVYIYKTDDEFNTVEKTSYPGEWYIGCMAMNSKNDLFAGTANGVYRSVDGGATWEAVPDGLVDSDLPQWKNLVQNIVINPNNDHIFATRRSAVFKSVDNGSSWTKTALKDQKAISALAINQNGVLFAAEFYDGVFYSADGGNNWSKLDNGSPLPRLGELALDTQGYLYAGTGNGLFRTDKPTTK